MAVREAPLIRTIYGALLLHPKEGRQGALTALTLRDFTLGFFAF